MKAVIHSLLLVIAQPTDREMARMVEYLKQENRSLAHYHQEQPHSP